MILPSAFIERTKPLMGDSWSSFENALAIDAPVSIRCNPMKASVKPEYEKVPWASNAYYLPQRPLFTIDPLLHAGAYYVQEASSMFLEQVVKQHIHGKVKMLDLCAAPGGKSTHILSLLPEGSLLFANEYVRSRAYILAENIQKWGRSDVLVCNNEPKDIANLEGLFDAILVDAPCSGEGMFRKDEGAVTEWSPENVVNCVIRQQNILKDIWPALKQDGLLIYSTCTYNREENEENVRWICENLDAAMLTVEVDDAWGITCTDGGYRFYPHKTKGEGFFMTVLRKKSEEMELRIKVDKQNQTLSNAELDLNQWINGDYSLYKTGDKILAFPSEYAELLSFASKKLRVISAGLALATVKGKDFLPDTALALSTALNKSAFSSVELDWKTAISFLRTENIVLPDTEKGFVLVCYKGFPLGWVKNLGNRCNSLYPSEWRIRMQVTKEMIDPEVVRNAHRLNPDL
jgi:16S rRNA C967 or C1407 C5-methylase (RsmB/RsmF family)/NOL1/NOP2/fmu family ribosome biogenesis protein